jgi:hypothetical protein
MVLHLCRLTKQTEQLLEMHYQSLCFNNLTQIDDALMARVIRAAVYTRLETIDFCGTNLGDCPKMFEQTAVLLEESRRYCKKPITMLVLSSTGLDEPHFRRIITAVQRMPRLMDPTGRPDIDAEDLDMHLEILNVRVFRDPLHQVDHGIFANIRF